MSFKPITYRKKHLTLHKTIINPDFNARIVLASDPWEYVDMWLKRRGKTGVRFFWQQARSFYNASLSLSKYSVPLTAYYSMLNMTKALLTVKGEQFSDEHHGLSGKNTSTKALLSKEVVEFKTTGVLPGLCRYLQEPSDCLKYTLKNVLYNLPYIHRAYCLTFSSDPELFVPITKPLFVKKEGSSETWFCADIKNRKYRNIWTVRSLPYDFEKEEAPDSNTEFTIRCRRRFKWTGANKASLGRLCNYHKRIRKHLLYINGPQCLWYIKRTGNNNGIIERSTLTLQFAAMHRLSELTRYEPLILTKHFRGKHNWLLSEFITKTLDQYVDEISAEITGAQIMIPGIRS